ncbi:MULTISPECIES: hypothetical protein [Bacillus cereus group]|uniref:Integron cassette protein domain-containing protein n=1 Tax=Bacillus cereus TaxID=1396 RepID=A0A5B9HMS5_BACCE|nr:MULTISPECIES: hypothetical protein [Bacillus cereus group]MEC1983143.1 hypothetical protein [Bacillus cereus]EJR35136.1 hypothetical protein IIE_02778 [Bacillus cereus VD045]MDY8163449.1 hypothetical protein [Bacillus thuringiensis]QEF16828.1 hypothetical protein FRY47_10730 [Bacillus cereus]HDR4348146.1 hypothetical protein [Bacillus cereus]
MAGIDLTPEQLRLKEIVEECLNILKADIRERKIPYEEITKIFDRMAEAGHKLHMSLKEQDQEPVHHRYMIQNRGMSSDDSNFYRHIHPSEDLLAFIQNVHANDDPTDQTIGHEFEFNVYTRRWGNYDHYKITRIESGWHLSHLSYTGDCKKDVSPILYESFRHDSINYPESLPGYFEWLWDQAQEEGLSHDAVQQSLNELAEWVSLCEKGSPSGIFGGYK